MLDALFRSSSLSLGVDIHSTEVRALCLRKKKGVYTVEHAIKQPLPMGAIVEGRIQQVDCVARAIKALVVRVDGYIRNAHIAFPMQRIMSRNIPVDHFPGFEDFDALQDYFPGVQDRLVYDYVQWKKDWLLYAVRQEEHAAYVEVCNAANIALKSIDIDGYAVLRAVNFMLEHDISERSALIVERQSSLSRLMWVVNGEIVHYQWMQNVDERLLAKFLNGINSNVQTCYLLGQANLFQEVVRYFKNNIEIYCPHFPEYLHVRNADDSLESFCVALGLALRGFKK